MIILLYIFIITLQYNNNILPCWIVYIYYVIENQQLNKYNIDYPIVYEYLVAAHKMKAVLKS